MVTLISFGIASVSASDIDNEEIGDAISDDVIGISNVTNQIDTYDTYENDDITENDVEGNDIVSASNDEDILRGDMGMSVVGEKKTHMLSVKAFI